ncbi:MAG: hypothetical protein AAFR63_09645, partial [Cyanobacteria bacterium J06631_6]
MPKNNPIVGFGIAENVANFLLHEAFYYVQEAATIEVASIIFSERIANIDPDPSWKIPEVPEQLVDWLSSQDEILENIIDPSTSEKLSKAWSTSLKDAVSSEKKIPKNKRFQSTENM